MIPTVVLRRGVARATRPARLVRIAATCALTSVLLAALAIRAGAQGRVRDYLLADAAAPVRLVGYGLVAGLDGTGDRAMGGAGNGQTVMSIVNLLRRFDVVVPPQLLRSRNVAAVLVTAEVSPYLRAGGRFDVQVASIGDAPSLRGGVLFMAPLVAEAGGAPLATAQGGVVLSEGADRGLVSRSWGTRVETSARIPGGGVIEGELPRPAYAEAGTTLLLREPDIAVATRIATVIDSVYGKGAARVDDPGAVTLTLKEAAGLERNTVLARLRELPVRVARQARVVIDGRDGTVVAGGDVTVGEAVVTHGGLTLAIGGGVDPQAPAAPAAQPGAPATAAAPGGEVRLQPGISVQRVASALHGVRTSPAEIAAIFGALRDVGAIAADVVIR